MKRILLILLISLGMAGMLSGSLSAQDTAEVAPVIVTLEALPRGFVFTEENVLGANPVVGLVLYPASSLPATAIQSLEDVVGRVLRTDLEVENPLVEHYLFPHPAGLPDAEIPYPISPSGYYVVREYGTYVEYDLTDLGRVSRPVRLAAGDHVDIIGSTALGDIFQDETRFIVEDVVIARLTDTTLTLSLTPQQRALFSPIWELGLPITMVLRAVDDAAPPQNVPIINWDYLTRRDVNPLLIPEGADITDLEG
jgi:Flp pilus assembly protein CpaB